MLRAGTGDAPTHCSLGYLPKGGAWNTVRRTFTPEGCTAVDATPTAASRCFRNRTFIFMGDSNIRDLGVSFASFLSGVTPMDAEDHKYDRLKPEQWEAARPQRSGMATSLFHHGYTHPIDGWTVRIVHRSYHQSWPEMLYITRNARPGAIVFVEIGIHAIAQVRTIQADLRTVESARAHFLHGYVFQPFIDYYCAAATNSSKVAEGSGTPVSATPLVWMTFNEMCAERMPARYHRQIVPSRHANKAVAGAAAEINFPMLEWEGLVTNRSMVCDILSDDGVHYRSWVDHVRARLLVSYLCKEAHGTQANIWDSNANGDSDRQLSLRDRGDQLLSESSGPFEVARANCSSCVFPQVWTSTKPPATLEDNSSCQAWQNVWHMPRVTK